MTAKENEAAAVDRTETDLQVAGVMMTPLQVVAPFFGPAGIVTAILVGALGGGATLLASRRSARRFAEFVEQLRAEVDGRLVEFDQRLRNHEDSEDLAVRAARAAPTASTEAQARAFASLVARGVLGDSGTSESELLVSVLDGITRVELDALQALDQGERPGYGDTGPSAVGVLTKELGSGALAEAAVAKLIGRGLLRTDPPPIFQGSLSQRWERKRSASLLLSTAGAATSRH